MLAVKDPKKDQDKYDGEYLDGTTIPNGVGTLTTPTYIYTGDWIENVKHGNAQVTYLVPGPKNYYKYEGRYENDVRSGEGVMTYTYRGKYEGNWANDMRNGSGSVELINGDKYVGEFLDDLYHGHGNLSSKNGSYIYMGMFRRGLKEGKGTENYSEGQKFDGTFVANLRNGMGIYTTTLGYSYNGEWRNGVKEGYGVEHNPNPRKALNYGKYIYEGEFYNGQIHGVGKMIFSNGNYYYGNFQNNLNHGIGFSYDIETETWKIEIKKEGKLIQIVEQSGLEIPAIFSGQADSIKKVHVQRLFFDDSERKFSQYYLFKDDEYMQLKGIELGSLRFLKLNQVMPDTVLSADKFLTKELRADYGNIVDLQVIAFLQSLISHTADLKQVINFYSKHQAYYYCFWMYLYFQDHLQKYPVAVSDSVPITEDGKNLFTQLEGSKNVVLTAMESAWFKYVDCCNLRLNYRRIDQIMLAFLGTGSLEFVLPEDPESKSFDYQEMRRNFKPDGYCWVYPREKSPEEQAMKLDPKYPYQIMEMIEVQKSRAVVLKAWDASMGLSNSTEKDSNGLLSTLEGLPRYSQWFDEDIPGIFILCYSDFIKYFGVAYFNTHQRDLTTSHYNHVIDQVEQSQFTNCFLGFKQVVNTQVRISVIQQNILKQKFQREPQDNDTQKNDDRDVFLPLRVMVGRRNLLGQHQIKRQNDNENQDGGSKLGDKEDKYNDSFYIENEMQNSEFEENKIKEEDQKDAGGNDYLSKMKYFEDYIDRRPQFKMSTPYYKYVAGKGQVTSRTLYLGPQQIEQGDYVIQLQFENIPELTEKVSKIRFIMVLQSDVGKPMVYETGVINEFMEQIYIDCAQRYDTFRLNLGKQIKGGEKLKLYQTFRKDENVYAQVYKNESEYMIWTQKQKYSLKNAMIKDVKNQKKPIAKELKPGETGIILIQQVSGAEFSITGGEGSYFMELDKIRAKPEDEIIYL